MPRALHQRILGGVTAAALTFVLASCGDGDEEAEKAAANAECPSNISTAVNAPLPSGMPSPDGVAYDYQTQGETKIWYFASDGSADDLVTTRDTYISALTKKSFEIEDTDQEEDAEAEAEFKGPHEGTI